MADMHLTQAEADALLAMAKHRSDEERYAFPMGGQSLSIALRSADHREHFLLDLHRARINLSKVKFQKRARQVVVLARLDLGGAHRNPDGIEVPAPHLHLYREGFGHKWADRRVGVCHLSRGVPGEEGTQQVFADRRGFAATTCG